MKSRKIPVRKRFDSAYTVDERGCWVWNKKVNEDGYARLRDEDGFRIYAHRLSYRLFNGPLIEGMEINHECLVRRCVNPKHLKQVTPLENKTYGDYEFKHEFKFAKGIGMIKRAI